MRRKGFKYEKNKAIPCPKCSYETSQTKDLSMSSTFNLSLFLCMYNIVLIRDLLLQLVPTSLAGRIKVERTKIPKTMGVTVMVDTAAWTRTILRKRTTILPRARASTRRPQRAQATTKRKRRNPMKINKILLKELLKPIKRFIFKLIEHYFKSQKHTHIFLTSASRSFI